MTLFFEVYFILVHNLRDSEFNIYISKPCTEAGKNSFHFQRVALWNGLSSDLKKSV